MSIPVTLHTVIQMTGTAMGMGCVTVVGLGVKLLAHVSPEAHSAIRHADKVVYVTDDPLFVGWIREQNSNTRFFPFFRDDYTREGSRWVEEILSEVRADARLCIVLIGHPGVCVPATHELVRQARREGIPASMLPGISVADCFFADLGEDPAESGCRCYDATDFLIRRRQYDRTCSLLLLQIDSIGQLISSDVSIAATGLRLLVELLGTCCGLSHEVILYRAAENPVQDPMILRMPLERVVATPVGTHTSLYVPRHTTPAVDPAMLDRLGLSQSSGK